MIEAARMPRASKAVTDLAGFGARVGPAVTAKEKGDGSITVV